METSTLLEYQDNGIYYVSFRYWKTGMCACSAKTQKSSFDKKPTKQDLINSIENEL